MNLLDPNMDRSEISDDLLIQEFKKPCRFKKVNLYALMAKRADHNPIIKNYLFEAILEDTMRKEIIAGDIKHAWLPALFILEHSDEDIKLDLKRVLKQWTLKEKVLFLEYIKEKEEYYTMLHDI